MTEFKPQPNFEEVPDDGMNIVPGPSGSVMRRGAMQSPNFSKGAAGWQINADGDVEFNNGVFRGDFSIGGTIVTVNSFEDIQTSIDNLAAEGGGTISLVPATYNATASITIPSGIALNGNGSTIDFGGGAFQILIQGSNAYSTGTISIGFGDDEVVGAGGATFTSAMVGRFILIGDYWYEITAFTDSTHINIAPNFMAPDVAGATFVIATTVNGVVVENVTLLNASGTLLKFRYVNGLAMNTCGFVSAAQGIDGDDAANINLTGGSFIDDCTVGLTYNNVPFCIFDSILISNITGGAGMDLNYIPNTAMGSISLQAINGVGVKYTNSFNLGFINYSIIECTSHGIELVSGNHEVDLISGYIDTMGGDGIKLTATSDRIHMAAQAVKNTTGYGVNIAASTCDENVVLAPSFVNNSAGTVNDAGTDTFIFPQEVGAATETFNSSGTWTKPSRGTMAFIQCWGGGGGGGGTAASAGYNGAGGGGGGAYTEKWVLLSDLGSTETVTIGAGGTAGDASGTDGGVGGNTTFGSHLTAYGGGGGGGVSGANDADGGGGGGGALGVGSVGGDTNGGSGGGPDGSTGGAGVGPSNSGAGGAAGNARDQGAAAGHAAWGGGGGGGGSQNADANPGGNSYYGGGGGGGGSNNAGNTGGTSVNGGAGGIGGQNAAGTAGTQPGGGGGGGGNGNSTARAGGAGGAGKVVVTVV